MEYKIEKYSKESILNGNFSKIEIIQKQNCGSKNFYWDKEGEEFYYNGMLYDIVHSDSLNFYCIIDIEEQHFKDDSISSIGYFFDKINSKKGLTYFFSLLFNQYLCPDFFKFHAQSTFNQNNLFYYFFSYLFKNCIKTYKPPII